MSTDKNETERSCFEKWLASLQEDDESGNNLHEVNFEKISDNGNNLPMADIKCDRTENTPFQNCNDKDEDGKEIFDKSQEGVLTQDVTSNRAIPRGGHRLMRGYNYKYQDDFRSRSIIDEEELRILDAAQNPENQFDKVANVPSNAEVPRGKTMSKPVNSDLGKF